MKLEEIRKRVSEIYSERDDDESAHSLEDSLHENFIKYIAKTGTKEQRKMAKEILRTSEFDFARWCA